MLAQLSKPLLGSLVGYFSNILGYKKSIFTFRYRQIYTGKCERSFGVCVLIAMILKKKTFYPKVLILCSLDALDKFYGQNNGQNICWIQCKSLSVWTLKNNRTWTVGYTELAKNYPTGKEIPNLGHLIPRNTQFMPIHKHRRTYGHRRTVSDHNSSLSTQCSGELKTDQ